MKLVRLANSFYFYVTLACLLTLTSSKGFAFVDTDQKAKLTAAFIYQITKFTLWPENIGSVDDKPFSICVLGQVDNNLYRYLSALETKTTRGRTIDVVQLRDKEQLFYPVGTRCEVLHSSNQEWQKLSTEEISQLGQTTLLIGASEDFLKQGGMLALVIVDDKMRIFINSENVDNTPIKLESRLKALATSI